MRVYLVFGTILKALWQILFAFGLISIVVNNHIMKKYICDLVTLYLRYAEIMYSYWFKIALRFEVSNQSALFHLMTLHANKIFQIKQVSRLQLSSGSWPDAASR